MGTAPCINIRLVVVGLEGAHAEWVGQSEGLAVGDYGERHVWRKLPCDIM